jgi:hypothetical protein
MSAQRQLNIGMTGWSSNRHILHYPDAVMLISRLRQCSY